HSNYDEKKINKIFSTFEKINNNKKIIITTEKDAVKIKEYDKLNNILKQNMFYIPIEINFIDKKEEFDNQIIRYVNENKRNN
ncbi:MAG: tetraacyldisaccharide 4'-kinase, partial [Bacteroidales bacterium]|nr:tetraacyldisaccharide 4'-kinase [Bacteroidales bacterium]